MALAAATAPYWPVAGPSGRRRHDLPRRARPTLRCAAAAPPSPPSPSPSPPSAAAASETGSSSSIQSGASAAAAAAGTDSNIDELIAWFAERRREEQEGVVGGAAAAAARQQQRQQQAASEQDEEEDDPGYMREYAALKSELVDSTRKCGGGMALYAFLVAGGGPALCVLAGAAASSLYVTLLVRDVDSVQPTDPVPIWEANRIESPLLRRLAKIAASYRAALRPRLLVPLALALGVAAFNAASPDHPLPLVDEGCVLAGFLAYKVALLIRVADAQWPASRRTRGAPALGGAYRDMVGGADSGGGGGGEGGDAGTMGPSGRPIVERFDDDLDQWGRPKKRYVTLPTAALPPEQRKKAEEQLAEDERKEERRRGGGGGGGGEGDDDAAA